ncbi:unnamed protein product [Dovyalis caffra]|uniref:Uncharacterized protein n=1 Tax=Dovyalis caffra TaxID=77055 RepID=A0AAV1S8W0_9ROSI|nr:unnamed protein product [Dovyalis caffra]
MSLKVTVLDSNLNVVISEQIHFDSDLPHYEDKDGVFRDPFDNGIIVSPTMMPEGTLDLDLEGSRNRVWILEKLLLFLVVGSNMAVFIGKREFHDIIIHGSKKRLVDKFGNAISIKELPIRTDSCWKNMS